MTPDPLNPNTNYDVPKSPSLYLKFEEGEVEFLPLSSAIIGYQYWNLDNKPVRSAEPFEDIPEDIREEKDGKKVIKHFWAFPVWDFNEGKVKVLEITQKTVMKAIRAYAQNTKWGNPVMNYSFTVARDDSESITKYNVMANPASGVAPEIYTAWTKAQENGFDITRLYKGEDPFKPAN
jgi:hypothetical protein